MPNPRKPNRCSKAYKTWSNMKWRCKNLAGWSDRGITVCERWQSFDNFFADMGDHPDDMSIDRIDNNGPYSPDNCRWANNRTQSNNRRSTRLLTYQGQTMSVMQWAQKLQMKHSTLLDRVTRMGWSVERALSTPVTK